MNIAIGSAFRNSAGRQVNRFFAQVQSLIELIGSAHPVRIIAAEGDSTDATVDELICLSVGYRIPLVRMDTTSGAPLFGSTEDEARMKSLSKVGNAIFDGVLPGDDILVY